MLKKVLLTLALSLGLSSMASAAFVNGTVFFGSSVAAAEVNSGMTSFAIINTANPSGVINLNPASTGTFAGFAGTNINVNLLNTAINAGNIGTLVFTFLGPNPDVTFTANSFTISGNMNSSIFINMIGSYRFVGDTDVQQGSLNLSLQTPFANATLFQGGVASSLSGSGTTVPEPGTYALIGSALLGLGLIRRRKA